jgi:hypothetical protein
MRTLRSAYSLGAAGLAEGTNANTFKTSNALPYAIDGRSYLKAATDNLAFSNGHTSLAAKEVCVFFVLVDSAGTVTTQQSAVYPGSQSQNYVARAIEWPSVADKAVIGAIKVETQGAAVFVPNTTDLGAADVVDTHINVADDYGVPITI